MKVEISVVATAMQNNQVAPEVLRRVIEEINNSVTVEDEEKIPARKKQYVILVSDPNGKMPPDDLVGWVLQIPEEESPATTQERIFRGAYDFNTTKRGRLLPVKTVGEAIESVPPKHFKEQDVWAKTKTPVLVLRTNNIIPIESPYA